MVLDRDELMTATAKILEENGIRYPISPDLRAVWEAKVSAMPQAAPVACCTIH
jgi:hypothetical protein